VTISFSALGGNEQGPPAVLLESWCIPSELLFFCWRLLGLIPGGTPFSQLAHQANCCQPELRVVALLENEHGTLKRTFDPNLEDTGERLTVSVSTTLWGQHCWSNTLSVTH